MPLLRSYKLFISHAWHHDDAYWRVVNWLDAAPSFRWENLSVPEHAAIDPNADQTIDYELRSYMRDASAFILCAGIYVSHSKWIDFEVAFARRIGRPIIAVSPWAAERLPAAAAYAVAKASRADTLVSAIRTHALPEGK